jgi:hypothetical protein
VDSEVLKDLYHQASSSLELSSSIRAVAASHLNEPAQLLSHGEVRISKGLIHGLREAVVGEGVEVGARREEELRAVVSISSDKVLREGVSYKARIDLSLTVLSRVLEVVSEYCRVDATYRCSYQFAGKFKILRDLDLLELITILPLFLVENLLDEAHDDADLGLNELADALAQPHCEDLVLYREPDVNAEIIPHIDPILRIFCFVIIRREPQKVIIHYELHIKTSVGLANIGCSNIKVVLLLHVLLKFLDGLDVDGVGNRGIKRQPSFSSLPFDLE